MNGPVNSEDRKIAAIIKQQLRQLRRQGRLLGRALAYRNFRLFFCGQGLSLLGTWVQSIAMSWLVYRLTGSGLLLGLVSFAGQIPSLLFSPFIGVWVDRLPRRQVLVATQALSLLQATILALLVWTGSEEIWHLLALSLLLGCINAADMPARQALVVELVEAREDRGNAIALNSVMFNATRLVGPALGGLLIPLVGEAMCFALNAVSYLFSLLSLVLLRLAALEKETEKKSWRRGFRDGWNYTFGHPPIRQLLQLLALMSLSAMPYTVLLPVLAVRYFGGGAPLLGTLMAMAGAGSLCGALILAFRRSIVGLERLVGAAALLAALSLLGLSAGVSVEAAGVLLFALGVGLLFLIVGVNTLLQHMVPDHLRGRVMSFYNMSFLGLVPVGCIAAGQGADWFGVLTMLQYCGWACLAAAILFLWQLPSFQGKACQIYQDSGHLGPDEKC
jgi:MFS family permease